MATLAFRPATPADVPAIARVHHAALESTQALYVAWFNTHPRDILPESTAAALQKPGQNFVVAVDAHGEVVGFVRYYIEEEEEHAPKSPKDDAAPQEETATTLTSVPNIFAPKPHLKELWAQFCAREDEMEKCYTDTAQGKRHYYVKHLMVDPAHQRKGIGKSLLQSVVAKADADSLPTFIVASAEAHGLYGKLGFQDLGTFEIDNAMWARRIAAHEKTLGITGHEDLEERCKGLREVERYMVRWPQENAK